jgi:LacI family transcriptional regulator
MNNQSASSHASNGVSINRRSPEPIFRQIYTILSAELNKGLYAVNSRIPSEKELCARFDVERNTVRRALQLLVDERRIVRVPGKGSLVMAPEAAVLPGEAGARLGTLLDGKLILWVSMNGNPPTGYNESFHYKLINIMEKRLSNLGCHLLLKSIDKDGELSESIRSVKPAGIIFDSYNQEERYLEAAAFNIPFVSVNHSTPLATSIVTNNAHGASQAAELLLHSGHKRIAYILGKRNYQSTQERLNGIRSVYAAQGLPFDESLFFEGNWLYESGERAARWLLAMSPAQRPTAVFAFNDDMAYGCLNALEKGGLLVPGNISIIGFDNNDHYSEMFRPVSTVDVNMEAMVNYAIWYLMERINGRAPTSRAMFQIDAILLDKGTVAKVA